MTGRLTIALDAMGGDNAPQIIVKGANIARQRYPQAEFLFFGREGEVRPLLDGMAKLRQVSSLVHTDDVVKSDDRPSTAIRNGRQSSMRLSINAVADGRAEAVVSAGNTGALMGMAKFVLKTLPGIDRPAIASYFPTLKGETVMLDLGANLQCDAQNLVDFAVMGTACARTVLGHLNPSFGLLNVGSEDIKGHEYLHEASAILRRAQIPGQFVGFVEGDDIAKGTVDVVVTDGFTGNVALKTAEGTAKLVNEYVRRSFRSSLLAGFGYLLARSALGKVRQRIDPRRYNGAMFIGLNGIVVKSHGGTDAMGFANAIGVAIDMVKHGFIDQIRAEAALVSRAEPSSRAAAV